MKKRVLFINTAKEDNFTVDRIHMGLTLLGGILKSEGHEVKVMDYAFLRRVKEKLRIPSIEEVVGDFGPDVIGISVFSYVYDECLYAIDRISKCSNAPIILGGPHFIMFPEDFRKDGRISYIVRGEAEMIISDLVANAKRQETPAFVDCPPPLPENIPPVNLDIAYGSDYLEVYQIQLSRGCPFKCSFCSVKWVAGHKVRFRDLNMCIEQIIDAKSKYPNIKSVAITDDVPTINKQRFKDFLLQLKKADLGCELTIDNVRADLIDEELVKLYKIAGGQNICLGTESGDPEVFELVNKGEKLDDIVRAARMIRGNGLKLGLCFVIGLPGDNLKKHFNSLKLAKFLKPDYVFWNMCIPWPGTEVRKWYDENGRVAEVKNFSTLIDPSLNYTTPPSSSHDFPTEDRIKAWLMANMETYQPHFSSIGKMIAETFKYKLYRSLAIYVSGKPLHAFMIRISIIRRYIQQFGFHYALSRIMRKFGIRDVKY